jgi:hypothetical protein
VDLGFADGNGLSQVSSCMLSPWAPDLEDNVKDMDGRGRSYLLGGRYKHTFAVGPIRPAGDC